MTEQIQDEIIVFEDFKEYDISYPVIITRWEIKQVHGINKQYLQVYFQRISDNVKAFKFNVKCYSAFGEVVEEISDISIYEVDKKIFQFSEVVPLKVETRKVKINLQKCCLLDNTVIESTGRQIAISNFKPFNDEDLEAAKRLLPNAKGLPVENVSHWYCACGVIHSSDTESCLNCKKIKKEIFSLITPESVQTEKINAKNREIESAKFKKKKKVFIASIASGCIAVILAIFLILWFTVIPTPTVKQGGLVYRLSTCHFDSDIESKCYNIERYEGNQSTITLQPVRGLPLIIQDKVNGGESVQTVIIKDKFNVEKELSYIINDCLDGFVNLKTLLVEGRLSFIDSDRVFMNGVEVVFGYRN